MKRDAINAQGQQLVLDGTADDGTYQGDGMLEPFVVFNVELQENVAGPFDSIESAKLALDTLAAKK